MNHVPARARLTAAGIEYRDFARTKDRLCHSAMPSSPDRAVQQGGTATRGPRFHAGGCAGSLGSSISNQTPVPLQEAAERLAEVEARAAKMAMELADFKTEATTLRNQDLTVRRLEERKKALEAQLAEKVGRRSEPAAVASLPLHTNVRLSRPV